MLASCFERMPRAKCPSRAIVDSSSRSSFVPGSWPAGCGQHLHQLVGFGGLQPVGRHADQVIGEMRQLFLAQVAVAEVLEERVVRFLAVRASTSSSATAIALASAIALGSRSR